MKPKKPKESASLKKVAKTYKKNTKQSNVSWDGARFFNEGAKGYGLGSSLRQNVYKPAAKSVTLGTTKAGKGATIKKKGRA
jgi:hypothetical protein